MVWSSKCGIFLQDVHELFLARNADLGAGLILLDVNVGEVLGHNDGFVLSVIVRIRNVFYPTLGGVNVLFADVVVGYALGGVDSYHKDVAGDFAAGFQSGEVGGVYLVQFGLEFGFLGLEFLE